MVNMTDFSTYYHIVDNFHYYENCKAKIKSIAKSNHFKDIGFFYKKSFNSLMEFDVLIRRLGQNEEHLRNSDFNVETNFDDDFFNDWFKVLYAFNRKNKMQFVNPILNEIFEK